MDALLQSEFVSYTVTGHYLPSCETRSISAKYLRCCNLSSSSSSFSSPSKRRRQQPRRRQRRDRLQYSRGRNQQRRVGFDESPHPRPAHLDRHVLALFVVLTQGTESLTASGTTFLVDLHSTRLARSAGCSHEFHNNCIGEWARTFAVNNMRIQFHVKSGKPSCPLCKTIIGNVQPCAPK